MFGQTFAPFDLAIAGVLLLLELALSADNALVLALTVKHLPKKDRRRALTYGLWGAFTFRFAALFIAKQIISLWWLQAIGGVYLVALPIKHLLKSDAGPSEVDTKAGFWKTVITVELLDIAFALDSILAGVAMVKNQSKLWVIFLGAAIGIVMLRLAASWFVRFMHKYPAFDKVAYLLVGWVGIKLALLAEVNACIAFDRSHFLPEMPEWLFWVGMGVIALVGGLLAVRRGNPELPPAPEDDPASILDS